jgi:hypothetical protein
VFDRLKGRVIVNSLRLSLGLLVLAPSLAAAAGADEVTAPPGSPKASVLVGFGNAVGWLGGQGEVFFSKGRFSAFLGLGYTPGFDDYSETGLTWALGARAFTRGRMHRAFLEVSVAQLAVPTVGPDGRDGDGAYGPGVQIGYQLIRPGGFTLLVSGGVGVTLEDHPGLRRAGEMFTLAIGKSWR